MGLRMTRERRVPPRAPRRDAFGATRSQRALMRDRACLVCRRSPCDAAHLIDKSLAPAFRDEPGIVVPLCRECHRKYDNHELDLSPYLEPYERDAVALAVRAMGLWGAVRRITGKRWTPIEDDWEVS